MYTPLRHWVINVRASYATETREQIEGLWSKLGYRKIGVIYPDDAFGAAVLDSVTVALMNSPTTGIFAFLRHRQIFHGRRRAHKKSQCKNILALRRLKHVSVFAGS